MGLHAGRSMKKIELVLAVYAFPFLYTEFVVVWRVRMMALGAGGKESSGQTSLVSQARACAPQTALSCDVKEREEEK